MCRYASRHPQAALIFVAAIVLANADLAASWALAFCLIYSSFTVRRKSSGRA